MTIEKPAVRGLFCAQLPVIWWCRLSGKGAPRQTARDLLSQVLQAQTASRVAPRLARSEHGKPYLPDFPELHFNLSHSGQRAMIAIDTRPIGIDLECATRQRAFAALATRYFANDEAAAIANAKNPARLFYRSWLAREAYLKGTGLGLRTELKRLHIDFASTPYRLTSDIEWRLWPLAVPTPWVAMVARLTNDQTAIPIYALK